MADDQKQARQAYMARIAATFPGMSEDQLAAYAEMVERFEDGESAAIVMQDRALVARLKFTPEQALMVAQAGYQPQGPQQ